MPDRPTHVDTIPIDFRNREGKLISARVPIEIREQKPITLRIPTESTKTETITFRVKVEYDR